MIPGRRMLMNKSDQLELRKRFKKESCTISRLAGCYVDGYKNKVLTFNENFLNLDEDEFYKYMDLARKTLSGTIGNNILELDFPLEEESGGGKQQFYMGLRESRLKNDDLLDRLYDMIIENYVHTGNFLILVFNDTYDIMSRTSDNIKLDESEEVYEYILVSICPVELSKPGLGYREEENRIGARIRDWVVGSPDTGFLFPAFDGRSQDIHKVDFYTKDVKDSHPEFVEAVIGTGTKRTAWELKRAFTAIVKSAYGSDESAGEDVLTDITESIAVRVQEEIDDADAGYAVTPAVLNKALIGEILKENEVEETKAQMILDECADEFEEETPELGVMINKKELDEKQKQRREKELVRENAELKEMLNVTNDDNSVIIKLPVSVENRISSRVIDDQKFVMIPVDDEKMIIVNGHEADL